MNAEYRKKEKEKKEVKKKKKKSIEAAIWQYGKICMKNWTLMVEGPMYYTSWHEAIMEKSILFWGGGKEIIEVVSQEEGCSLSF